MPPTFVYLVFLGIWVAVSCAVWASSLAMLLTPRTRRFSGSLCLAMAGTFPFVLAYQMLAAPVVGTILLCGWMIWKTLEPGASTVTENPVVISVSIATVLIAFGMTLLASLAGFYDGWLTGWRIGQGIDLRSALSEAPAFSEVKKRIRALGIKNDAAIR